MLTSILILVTTNPLITAYNYQDPNILIAPPTLIEETYTQIPLLILDVSSGGTEIVLNSAARNPNTTKGKNL